jgi:V/A-type H+-transporting ATPase subunit C
MSSDYGFINARVKGLKAGLLRPEFFSEVLDSKDFAAFTDLLGQSPYLRDLEESQARYTGIRMVDSAVARNFYRMTQSLLRLADGTPGELIGLMLLRYDLANIKAIARAKHAGRGVDDTQAALFPAGKLKPAVLETIAGAPDMAAVGQALLSTSTPLRSAFVRAAAQYQSDGDLYTLEVTLDRAYYRAVFTGLKRVSAPPGFVRHLRREVDATNLRTALKLRGQGAREEMFVGGGREISRTAFDSIVNDGSFGALQILAGTSFASVGEVVSLSEAEAKIREIINRSARNMGANPREIGIVVNYLQAKEVEIARVRLLARGKFYGVDRPDLEKELGIDA